LLFGLLEYVIQGREEFVQVRQGERAWVLEKDFALQFAEEPGFAVGNTPILLKLPKAIANSP